MRGGEWFKLWRRRNDGFDDADNRRSTGRHGGGPVRRTGRMVEDRDEERGGVGPVRETRH
jgi:hypothetical protein